MTTPHDLGYAFALSLPPDQDRRLHDWTNATAGASWDMSGGHVTLARFSGSTAPEKLVPLLHEACAGFGPFEAAFTQPFRAPYWDKPGLEIVMLVGETPDDVAPVIDLRQRLLSTFLPQGLALMEGGTYQPHVTLTTGLPAEDAHRLEAAAGELALRFTACEIVFWCGGETPGDGAPADPPWHVVERLLLT